MHLCCHTHIFWTKQQVNINRYFNPVIQGIYTYCTCWGMFWDLSIINFTITKRFLVCWLVENHGWWEYSIANYLVFSSSCPQFSEKHQRKWTSTKTNQQQFSMVCTLIDHRNYVEMLKTLQWNHSPVWLMVPLDEFWIFEVVSMV